MRAVALGTADAWYLVLTLDSDARGEEARFAADIAETQLAALHANPQRFEVAAFRSLDPRALARLESYFTDALSESGVPGGAFAIIEEGAISHSFATGLERAAHESGPVEGTTIFRVASLTKPLVAAVLVELAASKQLDIDRPIVELLGQPSMFGLGPIPADLTIRLASCSCFGLYRKDAPLVFRWSSGMPRRLDALSISNGSAVGVFGYNNQAFALGAYAATRAMGAVDPVAALPVLFEERLLEPLGLERTSLDEPTGTLEDRAGGHRSRT